MLNIILQWHCKCWDGLSSVVRVCVSPVILIEEFSNTAVWTEMCQSEGKYYPELMNMLGTLKLNWWICMREKSWLKGGGGKKTNLLHFHKSRANPEAPPESNLKSGSKCLPCKQALQLCGLSVIPGLQIILRTDAHASEILPWRGNVINPAPCP